MSDKKGRIVVLLSALLLLNLAAVYGQTFDPVLGLLQNLDPINVLYARLQVLIDFTIIFAIFFSVARFSLANRFGGIKYANPMIVAVSIALAGSFVWFERQRGFTLFSLLGNYAFFLFILLLGLFIYWAAGEPSGDPSQKYKKAAVFLLLILLFFKAFFASQWNDIFPSPTLRGIVDLLLAVGGLVFLIFAIIWFFQGIKGSFGESHAPAMTGNGPFGWQGSGGAWPAAPRRDTGAHATPSAHASHSPSSSDHGPSHDSHGDGGPGHRQIPEEAVRGIASGIATIDSNSQTMLRIVEILKTELARMGSDAIPASSLPTSVVSAINAVENGVHNTEVTFHHLREFIEHLNHEGFDMPEHLASQLAVAMGSFLTAFAGYRDAMQKVIP